MTTFAVCPASVREASWEAWETRRMHDEDHPAQPPPPEEEEPPCAVPPEEEEALSDLSAADSPRQRRQKLAALAAAGATEAQVAHLRKVRRDAKQKLGQIRAGRRAAPSALRHLGGLASDVDALLSCQTHGERNADGTFRQTLATEVS